MQLEHAYTDNVIMEIYQKFGYSIPSNINPQSYTKIFNDDGFYARKMNGEFVINSPFIVNGHFEEGTSITYKFDVKHDFEGMINLYQAGVKSCYKNKLCDTQIVGNFKNQLDNWFARGNICGKLQDFTHCIGEYIQSNEIAQHVPYLYTVIGYPELTCKIIQQTAKFFTNSTDGIPGNDDAGQMSAWLIFAAMGMHPVNSSSNIYILGCPIYSEDLKVGNVKVTRSGTGYKPTYYWNQVLYPHLYITHEQLVIGGHFHVELN